MPLGALLFIGRPGEKFAVSEEMEEEHTKISQKQNCHDRERQILLGLERPSGSAGSGGAMKNGRDEQPNCAQAQRRRGNSGGRAVEGLFAVATPADQNRRAQHG